MFVIFIFVKVQENLKLIENNVLKEKRVNKNKVQKENQNEKSTLVKGYRKRKRV